ncbi:MFS transporter [Elizabethkingia anophelis]|nr:MFS transporter [Elizabethkingia sp. HX YK]CAI9681457.1 hypothetical protein EAVNVH72_01687 [Elizabethkingia anophelis]
MNTKYSFLSKKNSLKTGLALSFFTFSMLLNCLSIVILNYFGQKKFVLLGSLEVFKDLPIAFLAAFISRYIPRIGHLNSIITGLSIAFVLCIITPFVDDFWFFKIWFLLIGLCFILVKISVLYITINLSRAEENGSRFMQFIEASFMAGIVIVNLIFGLIMGSSSPYLWKYGFWAIAFFSLLAIGFLYFGKSVWQKAYSNTSEQKSTITLNSWQVMKKSFLFLAIVFFIIITEQSFTTWLPTYSKAIFNADPFVATQTTVIFAFSALTGRVIYGMLIIKRSWNKLFAGLLVSIFIIVSCISGILIFEKPHQIFLYLIPCMGFFIGPLYPIINAHQLYSLPNEQERGSLLGLIIVFSSLASCTSSLVIGLTLDHIQPEYAFTLLFLPTIALSLLFLNYKRQPIS